MAKLQFTPKSIEDLKNIWNYTYETWSEKKADEYYRMLITACKRTLSPTLFQARIYREIDTELNGIKAGHHIIFFKRTNIGDILIIRILHERIDLRRH